MRAEDLPSPAATAAARAALLFFPAPKWREAWKLRLAPRRATRPQRGDGRMYGAAAEHAAALSSEGGVDGVHTAGRRPCRSETARKDGEANMAPRT